MMEGTGRPTKAFGVWVSISQPHFQSQIVFLLVPLFPRDFGEEGAMFKIIKSILVCAASNFE